MFVLQGNPVESTVQLFRATVVESAISQTVFPEQISKETKEGPENL